MKIKLMKTLIMVILLVAAMEVNILEVEASAMSSDNFAINYWWEIDSITTNAKLYSNVYMLGDVIIMIYPPPEGNAFWYESDTFYDVTVPSGWNKDYSNGIGGRTDIVGAGIGQFSDGKGKQFIHYSSGLFNSTTINGGLSTTEGATYSFSVNVPTQLVNTTVVPEPISSILFITGGTLLAGRRFFRRKS